MTPALRERKYWVRMPGIAATSSRLAAIVHTVPDVVVLYEYSTLSPPPQLQSPPASGAGQAHAQTRMSTRDLAHLRHCRSCALVKTGARHGREVIIVRAFVRPCLASFS